MDDPTRLLLESKTQKAKKVGKRTKNETSSTSTSPLLSGKEDSSQKAATESEQSQAGGAGAEPEMENKSRKSEWIILAIASGACAAFNGVFAKLYVFRISPFSFFSISLRILDSHPGFEYISKF
jgi:hypothetical protein